MGDRFKANRLLPENRESRECLFSEARGFFFGFIQTKNGRVGGLIDDFVFAGRFAELFG